MAKAKYYKVWIQIEELKGNGEPTGEDIGVLPDSLGIFEGRGALRKAMDKVAVVVNQHGIDPENSDSVKGYVAPMCCNRCGTPLRKDGKCKFHKSRDHRADQTSKKG